MPEGLKIVATADVTQAEKALNELAVTADKTGQSAGKDLQDGLNKSNKGLNDLAKSADFAGGRLATDFGKGVAIANKSLATLRPGARQAGTALQSLARVAQDAPFGFIAIQNNLTELPVVFRNLRQEAGSTAGALRALFSSLGGLGGVGLGISVLTSIFTSISLGSRGAKKDTEELAQATNEAAEKQKEYRAAIDNAAQAIIGQAKDIANLRDLLISTTKTIDDLTDATIRQGVAQFLFDKKNETLQKALAAEIEKQLILRQRLSKTSGIQGLGELRVDSQIAELETFERRLAESQGLLFVPSANLKRLKELNATLGESSGALRDLNGLSEGLGGLFKNLVDGTSKAKDGTDQYIAKAKELAEELRKIGFIQPTFSFFDSQSEQLEKARKVFADFNSKNLKLDPGFFKVPIEIVAPPGNEVQKELSTLEEGIEKGIISLPPVEIPATLTPNEQQNADIIDQFRKRFEAAGGSLKLPVDFDFNAPGGFNFSRLDAQFKEFIKDLNTANTAANILTNSFRGFFNALIQGENPIKAFFSAIGQSLLQLISQLIAASIRAAIFRALLSGANPAGAAGQAFSGFGTPIPAFAAGGMVTGSTLALVGEGAGTSRSNPEVIAPLDKLRSMIEGLSTNGTLQPIALRTRVKGNDIMLSQVRTSKRNKRMGANG